MAERGSGPPFFVVGCGRSGSTMLRLMLDAHPDLAVPGESHFIPPLWRSRRRFERDGRLDAEALAHAVAATPHFGHWKIPAEPYLARVRALHRPTFADVIEAAFLANAERHGKTRWADKTPIYVRRIELLAGLFPHARFVHLIRDGRDVALSYVSVPWGPTTIPEAAFKWRTDVTAGRHAGARLGPGRYREIRYEDLIDEPRALLEDLCGFVDLPFHEAMLEHHVEVDRARLAPTSGLPFHSRAATPPKAGVRDWRTQMAVADARTFDAIAGPLIEALGYERGDAGASILDRAAAAARIAGYRARETAGELKKRMRT